MKQLIQHYKPQIDHQLTNLIDLQLTLPSRWSKDVRERFLDSCLRGKSVRGCLFLTSLEALGKPITNDDLTVAAALECIHTAILIHDDILDHDDLRRGKASLHKQYQVLGATKTIVDVEAFGSAMALDIGDIGIFTGFSFLANLEYEPKLVQKILQIFTKEFILVGFGELEDIVMTYEPQLPTPDDILSMYLYKTARYTFSLPFLLAGTITKQSSETVNTLEKLGEQMGLLYQLIDDQLTLTGDETTVGKTIGNDISENKKTLYHILLLDRASDSDKQIIKTIFGNKNLKEDDIETIRTLLKTYEVEQTIQDKCKQYEQSARDLILHLPEELIPLTESLLSYLLHRNA